MPQSSTVNHLVFARAWSGKSAELGERLKSLIEPSRKVTGCLNFALSHSLQDPDLWMVSGCWVNDDAMNAWLATPHLQVFSELMGAYVVTSLDFHTFASADEALAKADQRMRAV